MKQGDSRKVTIIEPGIVKAIDGKEYYNDQRIIAGSPEDVEAYHTEQKLLKAIFGDIPLPEKPSCMGCDYYYDESRGYSCQGDVNACMYI